MRFGLLQTITLWTPIRSSILQVVAFRVHRSLQASHRTAYRSNFVTMATVNLGQRLESPSAERNRNPIWDVLQEKVVPNLKERTRPKILEIAAGAGVHTKFFTKQLLLTTKFNESRFDWYPTDSDELSLSSIQSYITDDSDLMQSAVVRPPHKLTLSEDGIIEPETRKILDTVPFDLIININMIHISPWTATIGLMKLAGEKLQSHTGLLYLYGPFKVNGSCCESNR
jgi:Protein of unknown function (DUF938)